MGEIVVLIIIGRILWRVEGKMMEAKYVEQKLRQKL